MNKKLNAKDFILIGVLTALMWIICMIISTVMSIAGPVTTGFNNCVHVDTSSQFYSLDTVIGAFLRFSRTSPRG